MSTTFAYIHCILLRVNALLGKWVLISSLCFVLGSFLFWFAGVFFIVDLFIFNNLVIVVNSSLKLIYFLVQSIIAGINDIYSM